jgi:hypothetical protein
MNAISAGRTLDLIDALNCDVLSSSLPQSLRDQTLASGAALERGS